LIAFVTLLLGLISGVYPIEVAVGGPVEAVEFTVDAAPAGRIEGPPWVARVDLGSDLRPRELVARALDAEGKEIARVSQWLNLPRPPAEVEVVLENGPEGAPKTAVLTWQSVNGVKPAAVHLTLDGEPLTVDARGRAALPPRDLKSLHVLTAELWFPPGLLARRDVVYGGEYGSTVSTDLTAVPVRVRQGAALPPVEGLQDWFSAEGLPAPVAAVEDGPGKVVIVRIPGGNEVLDKLVSPARRPVVATLRRQMLLGEDDRVRFLSLSSNAFRRSRVPAELFDMSQEVTRKEGGMFWLLTNTNVLTDIPGAKRRYADAVAVAGLQASAENYRRAVVLVVGREAKDASRYDPATVRAYLESIRVPLFVWSLYGPKSPAAWAWGATEDISSLPRLEAAVAKLKAELEAQKIVWIEGRHLPQAVALSPSARGVELPGVRQ
jgi:hypothetical protein